MSVPRSSLRNFLVLAKNALRTAIDQSQKITFVIGNESADLDSFACSLIYAYVRSNTPTPHAFTPLYVPVTNIPFSGIQLRPEFLALLPHADIEPRHLITLDDLPDLSTIKSKLRPENTKWILVDHNALQGTLGSIYSNRVGGVIDHHDEENKVPKDTASEPRIITKAGSCTSLVTEYCREAWDGLSNSAMSSGAAPGQGNELVDDGTITTLWDAQIAQLGLASILIDTTNLTAKDKTTEHDIKAAEYLEAKVMACPQVSAQFDRSKFFKEMDTAKKDIGGLQLHDILRKDYKEWTERGLKLGISSVVKPIRFLQEKARKEANEHNADESFLTAIREFSKERDLDIYATMTTSTSSEGKFQRELLLWAFTPDATAAAKRFSKIAGGELGLQDWHGSDGRSHEEQNETDWRKIWWQSNVEHSRKRVAPLLREAMN